MIIFMTRRGGAVQTKQQQNCMKMNVVPSQHKWRSKQWRHIKKPPFLPLSLREKRREMTWYSASTTPRENATHYLYGGHSSSLHVSTAVGRDGGGGGSVGKCREGETRRNRGVWIRSEGQYKWYKSTEMNKSNKTEASLRLWDCCIPLSRGHHGTSPASWVRMWGSARECKGVSRSNTVCWRQIWAFAKLAAMALISSKYSQMRP